jgi:hypothetical protein
MITREAFDEAVGLAERLEVSKIQRHPQTQVSLDAQLRALELIAVAYGLYDASDFLRGHLR